MRTPLTDPRSLGSSLVLHALVLLGASVVVLGVTLPGVSEPAARVLRGELDPVDNRAPAETGGGGPGELGGTGTVNLTVAAEGGPTRDTTADALLSEILPSAPATSAAPTALPGPTTSGLGVLPGPGTGGGGGEGGGSGGGVGRGVGPGTEFFGARERAGSFAYVIDCSGSMQSRGALELAKRELIASLGQLPPDARFSVVFYNLSANVFTDAQGLRGLTPATAANKERVRSLLATVHPDGGTDHMLAIRTALALAPEVIFFLSDGDLMTTRDVDELLAEVGRTRIQAIEFGIGANITRAGPLQALATASGGAYRYVDVNRLQDRLRR